MRSRAPRRRPGSSIGQEPVVKVQRVARMGIDAQRSGASELPARAVEVRRGRTAYAYRVVVLALRGTQGANSGPGNWQRKSTQAPSTTKAIPVWIVEEEQRSDRPH